MERAEKERITRDELFELVWSKPTIKVAKELYVSDVAVGKMCKRLEIPKPFVGYWQRLALGQKIKRPILAPLSAGKKDWIEIRPPVKPFKNLPKIEKIDVPIPLFLDMELPLIRRTWNAYKSAKQDSHGYLIPNAKNYLSLRLMNLTLLERSLLLFQAIHDQVKSKGYSMKIISEQYEQSKTIIVVDQEEIQISICQRALQVPHEKTLEEKSRLRKGYAVVCRDNDRNPTAKLKLRINNPPQRVRGSWSDGKKRRLEECLGEFIQALPFIAHSIKEDRAEAIQIEFDRVRALELRKQRELEEARRQEEVARLAAIEKKKVEELIGAVSNWRLAGQIREYIDVIKKSQVEQNTDLMTWCAWALQYAEKIDPLKECCLNYDEQHSGDIDQRVK